jgi:hypothetical protein
VPKGLGVGLVIATVWPWPRWELGEGMEEVEVPVEED